MPRSQLIVIGQAISVAFLHWLEAFAEEHGPVELWTGVDFATSSDRIRVRRLTPYNKSSYRTRLLAWIRFSLAIMTMLILVPRRIPVLAITNPPFMPLILVLHRFLLGRRYGIIEYDIYPQIMVAMGLLTGNSLIYRIWRAWHASALRHSELIITLSEPMSAELKGMAKTALAQMVVIPTWTNTTRIRPVERADNPFAREHLPKAHTVALYSGNLGVTHSIETIIDVAELLRRESRIQFLVIGDGAKYAYVEAAIASGRTPNIKLLPLQPAEVVPFSLASADIAFVTLASGYERLSLPSKTYDMMAAGCAIIGVSQSNSGLDLLLAQHACGRNFTPDQADKIASWILELVNDRDRMKDLKQAARKAAVEHFSVEQCEALLTNAVLARLVPASSLADETKQVSTSTG